MKLKTLFLVVVSGTFLASCTKNYVCNCTSTVGKASYQYRSAFNYKKDAETWCNGSKGADGSNVTCSLEVNKIKKSKKDKDK
jgi:hypothetical protein